MADLVGCKGGAPYGFLKDVRLRGRNGGTTLEAINTDERQGSPPDIYPEYHLIPYFTPDWLGYLITLRSNGHPRFSLSARKMSLFAMVVSTKK